MSVVALSYSPCGELAARAKLLRLSSYQWQAPRSGSSDRGFRAVCDL